MHDGLFREIAGRIVANLTRILGSRHLELAEECVQDAMIRAMETWPFHGVPQDPAAWLMRTARNRAIDVLRRDQRLSPIPEQFERESPPDSKRTTSLIDEELGMMLLCCHPSLSRESQVALTLKTVAGLGVQEIARAYLVPDATIAQRLVRAKRQIREEDIPFDLPDAVDNIDTRLDAVLEVLYLLFNEGFSLCAQDFSDEAIRLARLLVAYPSTALPKCHALLALMLLQSARDAARIDAEGSLVLLRDQQRTAWDRQRIAQGMRHLDLAVTGAELTRYHIEAGIASVHAVAGSWESTDWTAIARSYKMLEEIHPTPVVRLNRAVAVSQVQGPGAGLQILEGLDRELAEYQPYHAACGYFWLKLERPENAASHYQQALRLARTKAETAYFQAKLLEIGSFVRSSSEFA
jgi:RNA polymerase sigma-70 factor, ECF subfamily